MPPKKVIGLGKPGRSSSRVRPVASQEPMEEASRDAPENVASHGGHLHNDMVHLATELKSITDQMERMTVKQEHLEKMLITMQTTIMEMNVVIHDMSNKLSVIRQGMVSHSGPVKGPTGGIDGLFS